MSIEIKIALTSAIVSAISRCFLFLLKDKSNKYYDHYGNDILAILVILGLVGFITAVLMAIWRS